VFHRRVAWWLSDCVNEETLSVPPGDYALLFEIGYLSRNLGEEAEWIRLTFAPHQDAQPEVLRVGVIRGQNWTRCTLSSAQPIPPLMPS
jgi:hypothetical protein